MVISNHFLSVGTEMASKINSPPSPIVGDNRRRYTIDDSFASLTASRGGSAFNLYFCFTFFTSPLTGDNNTLCFYVNSIEHALSDDLC